MTTRALSLWQSFVYVLSESWSSSHEYLCSAATPAFEQDVFVEFNMSDRTEGMIRTCNKYRGQFSTIFLHESYVAHSESIRDLRVHDRRLKSCLSRRPIRTPAFPFLSRIFADTLRSRPGLSLGQEARRLAEFPDSKETWMVMAMAHSVASCVMTRLNPGRGRISGLKKALSIGVLEFEH